MQSTLIYVLLLGRMQRLGILLLIILALIPAYYIHILIRKYTEPKRSGSRFILYLLLNFAFVFLYTYLVSLLILNLFPVAN